MKKIPFTDTMKFDPQTTLFVTDLDGTLLTPDATLPEGAAEAVWDLHRHGVHLTYATARTIRSAAFILEGLPFPAPIALMNGVLMRDMNEGRYVDSNLLSPEMADRILSDEEDAGKRHHSDCFRLFRSGCCQGRSDGS